MQNIYTIIGGKWFDSINGNTYHNAKIIWYDKKTNGTYFFHVGFKYGYGSSYLEDAKEFIKNNLKDNNPIIIDGGSFYIKKTPCKKGLF